MKCTVFNRNAKIFNGNYIPESLPYKNLQTKTKEWLNKGYCIVFYSKQNIDDSVRNNYFKKIEKIFHNCSPVETYNSPAATPGIYMDVTSKEVVLDEDFSFVGDTESSEELSCVQENENVSITQTNSSCKKNPVYHLNKKGPVDLKKKFNQCHCFIAKHIRENRPLCKEYFIKVS